MLLTTQDLRCKLLSLDTTDKKIQLLSGAAEGQDMIVTGCGPALNHVSPLDLEYTARKSNVLLCAIKESLGWWQNAGVRPDFHVTSNCVNYPAEYKLLALPIVFYLFHPDEIVQIPNAIVDVPLRITKGPPNLKYKDRAISRTRQFDNWLFSKRTVREYGPTIFPTVVLYLAVHLKIRNLYTIGVDMTGVQHFYETAKQVLEKHRGPNGIKDASELEQSWFIHAAAEWKEWLQKQGVSWFRIKTPERTNLGVIPEIEL